jgi:hypothetical protein
MTAPTPAVPAAVLAAVRSESPLRGVITPAMVGVMTPMHQITTYGTAFGWTWACTCGRESNGSGAIRSQAAAYGAGERHIRTEASKRRQSVFPVGPLQPDPDEVRAAVPPGEVEA